VKRKGATQFKTFVNAKVEPSKTKRKRKREETLMDAKGKPKTQPTRNLDIKCCSCFGVRHILFSV
jgi:hypothetical protein